MQANYQILNSKSSYKNVQGTHRRLQGNEWEWQQYEKGNRNYKQEPGINEEYNFWNKTRRNYKQAEWSRGPN